MNILVLLFLIQQFLVEDLGELHIQMHWVVNSDAEKHSNELESDWRFISKWVEPVHSWVVLWDKHVKIPSKNLIHYHMEVFVLDSALISTFFSNELDTERVLQIMSHFSKFFHWVIYNIFSVYLKMEISQTFETEISIDIELELSFKEIFESIGYIFLHINFLLVDRLNSEKIILEIELKKERIFNQALLFLW